jgi:hypothetical protein
VAILSRRTADVAYASGVRTPNCSRRLGTAILLATISIAIAGCRRAPRREIEQAKSDLAVALRVQAQIYAPASFQEARLALQGAERLVHKKRYDDARTLALESSSRARGALGIAAENRKKMLVALRLKIETTDRELTDATDEMKIAQLRGVDEDARQLFGAELIGAKTKQDEARRRLAAQDLVEGKRWADDADVAAASVLRDIRFSIARKQSEPAPRKSSRKKTR